MIIGSIVQGIFANKAGDAQADAAQQGIAVTRQNFEDAMGLIEPQIFMGNRAREALAFELGIGEKPYFTPDDLTGGVEDGPDPLSVVTVPGGVQYETYNEGDNEFTRIVGYDVDKFAVGGQEFLTREAADAHLANLLAERETAAGAPSDGFEYRGFEATPGYQFQLDQGNKAIERSAAARGMTLSAPTLQAHQSFSQGLANQEYGNYLNRLAAMSGSGQTATNQAFAGLQNSAAQQANLLGQAGNAQASSYAATGQAFGSGINNLGQGLSFLLGG